MLLPLFLRFLPFLGPFLPLFLSTFLPFLPRNADNYVPACALFADDVTGALPPNHGLRRARLFPVPGPAKRGDRRDLDPACMANLAERLLFGQGATRARAPDVVFGIVDHSNALKNLSLNAPCATSTSP